MKRPNIWPWGRKEERSTIPADPLINALLLQATGGQRALPQSTAAAAMVAGVLGRAFANANINGIDGMRLAGEMLGPAALAQVVRTMALYGQYIGYPSGGRLIPASSATIHGNYNPAEWRYELTLAGPTDTSTVKVGARRVLHFRWAADVTRPWVGIGPLQDASLDSRLLAQLVKALGDEAAGPRGSFIPIPKTGGQDETVDLLKQDIAAAEGSALLVESMADSWQAGGAGQANMDWGSRRFGADTPVALVTLYQNVNNAILGAFGLSPQVLSQTGNAGREGWRMALHSLIHPLANIIEDEISQKGFGTYQITFDQLNASDLQGRARSFQSLTAGGMDATRAAEVCGF